MLSSLTLYGIANKHWRFVSIFFSDKLALEFCFETMEANLEAIAEQVLQRDNVVGVLCVDSQGLPIIANGAANGAHSSVLIKVSELAGQLNPSGKDSMAFSLDTETCRINAKSTGNILTAIYKKH